MHFYRVYICIHSYVNVYNHVVFLYSFILAQFFIIRDCIGCLACITAFLQIAFYISVGLCVYIYIYINDKGHVLCHNSIYLARV